MNVSEALIAIRHKTNDRDEVGNSNEELLAYLNEAIQYISQYLIGANSPTMVQDAVVNESNSTEIDLPPNFVKLCGTFPIRITGNKMQLLGELPIRFRYFASFPLVEMDGEMPFHHDELNQIAIRLACIYVSNQQELDVQQDQALLKEIQDSIAAAIK